jgi:hypothetical protein
MSFAFALAIAALVARLSRQGRTDRATAGELAAN